VKTPTLCVVGLGYVGLPLAHAFAKAGHTVLGYDIDASRVAELKEGKDRTRELSEQQLKKVKIIYSNDPSIQRDANIKIIVMPTPVDAKNKPDLSMLTSATRTTGKYLRRGDIVVYESTVYPGVTEEICGPLLERESGLRCGKDFTLGYSPERINPGDREHTVSSIVKVVVGQDKETTTILCNLYGSIASAGVHRAPSIRVAEMAKAIENAQRDINIAYMNEIAMMCEKLGMATSDVLAAARTKWNFLPFTPGLVGGHCIGVDPYYLLEQARTLDLDLPLLTAARKVNDGMPSVVLRQVLHALQDQGKDPKCCNVLTLGSTFKENIPDVRNSKALEILEMLTSAGCHVQAHDPYHNNFFLEHETIQQDAILLLVPHREYLRMTTQDFATLAKQPCLFYDLKSVFRREEMEGVGFTYLAL